MRRPAGTTRAFTLVEMLVVVVLIATLLALTIPTVTSLTRNSRGDAGVNSVNTAVTVTRAYALQSIPSLSIINPASFPDASYSGAAIVFANSNELRLVQNEQAASSNDPSPQLLEGIPELTPLLNGYIDIPGRDYITMPKGTGVLGIVQTAAGLQLLPPPFAVRFNNLGQLVVGDNTNAVGGGNNHPVDGDRVVFYNGNNDPTFTITSTITGYGRANARPSGGAYNPNSWDPESQSYLGDSVVRPDTTKPYKLPFDALEAVVGVLLYSKNDFINYCNSGDPTIPASYPALGGSIPGQMQNASILATDIWGQWLLKTDGNNKLINTRQLFFSRYTGTVMREQ